MAHDHLSEGAGGEKSTRRPTKSNSCANMEEEGQQERLQFLHRHITTQPCRENVRKYPRAAHSSENRTSPQRRPVWLQKRKRVYPCNLCTPTTVREGDEYDQDLHLVFVDQEKAFDRVSRDKLWKVLEQYGVMGQLLETIRAIYANSKSAVRTASGTSDWFPVTSGVRQGCNLPPLLFVIYMDQITKEANPDPEALNEIMFADDQAMMNNDKTQLQQHIDQLKESCETYSMK